MIYGIGVDMASIARVQKACEKNGFEARFFSEAEQQMFAEYPHRRAANFAAKEAFAKALGTGIRGFSLHEVAALRDELGKPYYVFSGKAAEIVAEKGLTAHLSITDEGDNVIAMALLEQR